MNPGVEVGDRQPTNLRRREGPQPVAGARSVELDGAGEPAYPVWVVPLIVTAPVMSGNGVAGEITLTPEPAMPKLMMSGPARAFVSWIAGAELGSS